MKNRQEFIKKMSIADDSFTAISNFYGKIKANPHHKAKLINSIKKEINKITRIKEVFKNPSWNYATEDKERLLELRDRLDEEDRKLRSYQKKGYLSGEEDEDGHLIDMEEKDFMVYYYSRFMECKNEIENEQVRLQNINKRNKKGKNTANEKLKEIHNKIWYFGEHHDLLELLMEHKEMIDEDKLENIKEDMEHFLNEPHDEENRGALTSEYQQILADINNDLEEERIENLKKVDSQNLDPKDEKLAVFDNINTEDNMVQPNEADSKKGKNKSSAENTPQSKSGSSKEYDSKKKSFSKEYLNDDKKNRSEDKSIEQSEKSEESEAKESVIIKKVNKNKGHAYKHQQSVTPPVEEPEKPKELQEEINLEDALKPTPIITHSMRTSKDLSKRKKSVKKENIGKSTDNNLQVDSQNFPALGQTTPPIEENTEVERKSSKKREQVTKSPVIIEPLEPPEFRKPPPAIKTMFNSKTTILELLDTSYNNKQDQYEQASNQNMAKLSESALFLIFYYQQGTYSQVLAGEELTRRKWEYKSKFQTWFRNNDKGDKSKGDRIYFDFGPDWTTKYVSLHNR